MSDQLTVYTNGDHLLEAHKAGGLEVDDAGLVLVAAMYLGASKRDAHIPKEKTWALSYNPDLGPHYSVLVNRHGGKAIPGITRVEDRAGLVVCGLELEVAQSEHFSGGC
ncbi:hypothetical protein [Hyperthermus butylicus]|uniref:hypothetical protein n=1 Tax=Hyperthermus butylicus TaxID=54248 RepID=UPI00064E95EB|nr:hypothetical protein [Hyperthermus butylicus]